MIFPREILINKNAQVFNVSFRLETNTFIVFIIKHVQFWLVSKSLLVGMKNYEVGFINVESLLLRVSLVKMHLVRWQVEKCCCFFSFRI